jgi:hypothetical protein
MYKHAFPGTNLSLARLSITDNAQWCSVAPLFRKQTKHQCLQPQQSAMTFKSPHKCQRIPIYLTAFALASFLPCYGIRDTEGFLFVLWEKAVK